MTENKYYVPSIEEFCVGFEFEKYDERVAVYAGEGSTNWHKHTYDLRSIRLSQLPSHLFEKTIRTKYLDEDDVKELGWEHLWNNYYSLKTVPAGLAPFKYVILSIYNQNCIIAAYIENPRMYDEQNENKRFNGRIKNKSELKKVMKMLRLC